MLKVDGNAEIRNYVLFNQIESSAVHGNNLQAGEALHYTKHVC